MKRTPRHTYQLMNPMGRSVNNRFGTTNKSWETLMAAYGSMNTMSMSAPHQR